MPRKHYTSGFVYIWFDRKHKRYYVGSHWGEEGDGYVCSSTWMRNAYNYRPNDFKRRILQRVTTNKYDLHEAEHRWLQMMKTSELKNRYYNICNSVKNHWMKYDGSSKSVRQKISIARKQQVFSEESKKKRAESIRRAWAEGRMNGMRGKTHTDEYKARLRVEKSGPLSPAHLESVRAAGARRKGIPTGKSSVTQRVAVSNKLKEMWQDPDYREKMTRVGRTATLGKPSKVRGTVWWTDGTNNVRRRESPGPEWRKGRF